MGVMPKAKHGANRKYDLDLAKSLYMMGMEVSEILEQPQFEGMSPKYLNKIRWEGHWATERKAAHAAALTLEGEHRKKAQVETIKDKAWQIKDHYRFTYAELEAIRKLIEGEKKQSGAKNIRAHMDMVADYNDLATKVLGLDEQPGGDPNEMGWAFLTQVHTAKPGSPAMMLLKPVKSLPQPEEPGEVIDLENGPEPEANQESNPDVLEEESHFPQ